MDCIHWTLEQPVSIVTFVIPTLEMLTHVITLQTLEIPSLRQKPLKFLTLGFLETRSAVAFITGQSEGPSRMSKFTGNTVIQV